MMSCILLIISAYQCNGLAHIINLFGSKYRLVGAHTLQVQAAIFKNLTGNDIDKAAKFPGQVITKFI